MTKKTYVTTVELQKESMKFSAGHTTIFSATEREPLHGHMYQVYLHSKKIMYLLIDQYLFHLLYYLLK